MPISKDEVSASFPVAVQNLAQAMGWPVALSLVKAFGGCNLRIPRGTGSTDEAKEAFEMLVEAIGREAATALGEKFGGEELYVPRCANALRELRNARIRMEFDHLTQTLSSRRVCSILVRKFGISYRTVEQIINRPPPRLPPQLEALVSIPD